MASTTLPRLRIGWIGCGVMGVSMCKHCITVGNHAVFVYSRTPAKCAVIETLGGTLCHSPADIVAQKVDVIVSMAGFPKETEEIVFGRKGLLEALSDRVSSPLTFIDMSTNDPALTRRIAAAVEAAGSTALDAPVSGGDVGARNRKLSIVVGGDFAVFQKLEQTVFGCMTDTNAGGAVRYMGPSGSGQLTKVANQILIATNMIGVCEALLYAKRAGLEMEKVLAAVSGGAAGSWSLSNLGPRMLKGDFEPGFIVDHFIKDMGIALDEAKRLNLALPGLALAHQLYIAVKAQGHGRSGSQALLLALEQLNGNPLP